MSRVAPLPKIIKERASAQDAMDKSQAWLLIGLGIPFAVVGMFGLQVVLGTLVYMAPVGLDFTESMLLSGGITLVAVIIDTWRHPSEHWVRTRYTLVGGGTSGPEFSAFTRNQAGGLFSGMPLMTNMSDPSNLGKRGMEIANGCGNVILGGPRNIRKGAELLLFVRARSSRQSLDAAHQFLEWLANREPLPDRDMEKELGPHPILASGYFIADNLDFLVRRKENDGKVIDLR